MKYSKQEVEEARETLLRVLKPGDKVYTILRNVSRSGMSRDISLVVFDGDRKYTLDWSVARILDYPLSKGEGVKVGGCGMDMGFHVVYSLSSVLFKDFRCIGDGCQSNDHFNGDFDRSKENIGRKHSDGGYALSQEWL